MWNKTLDPKSPDFKYSEAIQVAASDGLEDADAIDPGLLLDPTTGRLWACYGTYFGFIRIIEIDPNTGKRVEGNIEKDIAIDCEATDLIYRDGWYYLLGVIDEGVEIMSCHYEADLDQGGRSVLGIRPLLWKNGWPVAGDRFKEGTYEIESERRGYALELAVDFVRMQTARRGFWGRQDPNEKIEPVANQPLSAVIGTWPAGNIDIRIGDYMFRPHQSSSRCWWLPWRSVLQDRDRGYTSCTGCYCQLRGDICS